MSLRQRRTHVGVEADVIEVFDYYRAISPELPEQFLGRLRQSLDFVEHHPLAGGPLFESYRHVVLRRFPYMIVYAVTDETVDVLAAIHVRRDPAWIEAEVTGRTFE